MASRIREMFSSNEDPTYRVHYAQQQQPHLSNSSRSSNNNNNYAYTQHQHQGPLPVVELKVPMCCEKCKEKVQEELEDMDGVRSVVCDQFHQRVTVAGHVDPLRVLKRVKKVKKKSEFFTQGSYINKSTSPHSHHSHHSHHSSVTQAPANRVDSVRYSGQHPIHQDSVRAQHPIHQDSVRYQLPSAHTVQYSGQSPVLSPVHRDQSVRYTGQPLVHSGAGLTRANSFERGLSRQPSFGKLVAHYDYPRQHQEFESRDLQREYHGIRRMPSFKKHRYHDAEYVAMGDEFTPQYGETHYAGSHPAVPLQSQVSFSKLPVRNPQYVKPVYHEY